MPARFRLPIGRPDPAKLALMRRINQAFDLDGILRPGSVFESARS
ncbi:MAG: hypothetical protein ACRD0G_00080 [Acidimicrobiales bacterium]